jgi:arylsulfatase A-like enzyme
MGRAKDKDGKLVKTNDADGKALFTIGDDEHVWGRSPLYEETIDIPLFIHSPNIKPGTYKGLTSAVDLMPTVMDLMGQEIPSFVEGNSLLPMMKNTSTAGRKYVVSTHQFVNLGESVRSVDDISRVMSASSSTTVTTEEWSLLYEVEQGQSELYNLKSDPKQLKNVIKEYPDKARELHQLMVKLMRETNAPERALKPRLELKL